MEDSVAEFSKVCKAFVTSQIDEAVERVKKDLEESIDSGVKNHINKLKSPASLLDFDIEDGVFIKKMKGGNTLYDSQFTNKKRSESFRVYYKSFPNLDIGIGVFNNIVAFSDKTKQFKKLEEGEKIIIHHVYETFHVLITNFARVFYYHPDMTNYKQYEEYDFWMSTEFIDTLKKFLSDTCPTYYPILDFIKNAKNDENNHAKLNELERDKVMSVKEIILWVIKNKANILPHEIVKLKKLAEIIDPKEKIVIVVCNYNSNNGILYLVSNFCRTFYITTNPGCTFDVRYNFLDFWLPKDYLKIITEMLEYAGEGFELNRISDLLKYIKEVLYNRDLIPGWLEDVDRENKHLKSLYEGFEKDKLRFGEDRKKFDQLSEKYFAFDTELRILEERKKKLVVTTNEIESEKVKFESEKKKFYEMKSKYLSVVEEI